MNNSADTHKNCIITILNGARTELTEDEIELLFEYRLADEDSKREIQELIERLGK